MSVGLENLQRRFQTALSDVGYSGPAARLPPEAGRNERLLRFVEWSLQAVQPANHLSTAELERLATHTRASSDTIALCNRIYGHPFTNYSLQFMLR